MSKKRDPVSLGGYEVKRMRNWYFEGYEPVEVTDKNGKTRVQYEYYGKYYSFGLEKADMRKMKLGYLWPLLIFLAFFIWGVTFRCALARMLPGVLFLFNIIPLVYFLIGFYGLLFLKEEFTTRERYGSVRRVNNSVIILAMLSVLDLVVTVYYMFAQLGLSKMTVSDYLFLLCVLALTVGAIWLAKHSGKYKHSLVRDESKEEN